MVFSIEPDFWLHSCLWFLKNWYHINSHKDVSQNDSSYNNVSQKSNKAAFPIIIALLLFTFEILIFTSMISSERVLRKSFDFYISMSKIIRTITTGVKLFKIVEQNNFHILHMMLTQWEVLWIGESLHKAHGSKSSPGDEESNHACESQL